MHDTRAQHLSAIAHCLSCASLQHSAQHKHRDTDDTGTGVRPYVPSLASCVAQLRGGAGADCALAFSYSQFWVPRADTSVHLDRWSAALRSLLPEIRCEDGPHLLFFTLLMAWDIKERLSYTGWQFLGSEHEFIPMSTQHHPVSELEIFCCKYCALGISAWTKGKTQVRLHCAGPGMHGIQIASKIFGRRDECENDGTDGVGDTGLDSSNFANFK